MSASADQVVQGRRLPGLVWLRANRRRLLGLAAFAVAVVLAKIFFSQLADHGILQAQTPWAPVLLGAIIGMTYGLLAVGLVLIYRTNRIINFAHGQIGAFAAAFFGLVAVTWHVPYWLAFPIALLAGAGAGAGAETGVVRRLRSAPRIMSVVATLAVGEVLVVFASLINSTASAGALYPQPSWLPQFSIGPHHALLVTRAYSGMLIISPLAAIALAVFLRRSRFGLAIRAAAANPEAARMSGIFASRMSSLAWAIAGALSAITGILTAPTQGFATADTFGPELLLRAMTAAVIARMNSIPLALAGGVGLGILEQLLLWNYPQSGLVEVVMVLVILVVLLFQRQHRGRDEEKGTWTAVQALRPLPARVRQIRSVRALGPGVTVASLVTLGLLPLLITNSLSVSFTGIIAFSVVGLSIGVLAGLGGQLSLGQFAVAAVGALVSYLVTSHGGNFILALVYAGLTAAVASVAVGLPSLRIRGLMLTVTTLGFALAVPAWLLNQPWAFGSGVGPRPPVVLGHTLDSGHSYYYFALLILVLCLLLSYNIRRSGFGRLLIAIRDNEDAARAFSVRAGIVKLQGYLIAGFIAGIGGALYGHSLLNISSSTFPASDSINIVVMTVFGGLGFLAGPILGAVWVLGLPLFNLQSLGLLGTNVGILILILWKPGGLAQLLDPIRERVVGLIARRHGIDLVAARVMGDDGAAADPGATSAVATASLAEPSGAPASNGNGRVHQAGGDGVLAGTVRPAAGQWTQANGIGPAILGPPLLVASDLVKRFGGIRAVDGVSIHVRAHETLGLIGPNGAGKTTTFELLGGFTRPDAGRIVFDHQDVSHLSPEQRAARGLIRSFQDAALFPTMTVLETVMLAQERVARTPFLASALGLSGAERKKEPRARQLVAAMGLERYQDKQTQELSTGTRRIVEIACLVACEPKCLLLDEPSSGIAQRETEALGSLLESLKHDLGLTLIVIEHDMPLILGLADRVVVMDSGRVIADGHPDAIATDPKVVEAYMGGSVTAVERSTRRRPAAVGTAMPTG